MTSHRSGRGGAQGFAFVHFRSSVIDAIPGVTGDSGRRRGWSGDSTVGSPQPSTDQIAYPERFPKTFSGELRSTERGARQLLVTRTVY